MCRSYLIIVVLLLGCSSPATTQVKDEVRDGLYMTCDEISGYFQECLELDHGRFRYWRRTDRDQEWEHPQSLSGTYKVVSERVLFEEGEIGERVYSVLNGVPVLWRKDGLEIWTQKRRIHEYGILMRTGDVDKSETLPPWPSIERVYSEEMKSQRKGDYEERFNQLPDPARTLLRAYTAEGSFLKGYKKEIERIRAALDPKILVQLVGLMGRQSAIAIEAERILTDIYVSDGTVFKEEPAFKKDPGELKVALSGLVEALGAAPDRSALEQALYIFLRASSCTEIDLVIEEAGVRIYIEARANGSGLFGSEVLAGETRSKEKSWSDKISVIVPACQQWMRKQLESLQQR
jgi:hypothetical protein